LNAVAQKQHVSYRQQRAGAIQILQRKIKVPHYAQKASK
jgi:hypothetical protein